MITEAPTLDQVLDLAHKLPRTQRGELIAQLARELASAESQADAGPSAQQMMSSDEARAAWAQLRAKLSAQPAGEISMAEQLERDRRERDRSLMGRWADQAEDDDVHS